MKKLIIFASVIPFFLFSCTSKCIEDSGIRKEKITPLKEFSEIEIGGPIKLILKQDSSFNVKISADSSILDKIEASVSGSTLQLKLDTGAYCGKDSILIHAGLKTLKYLKTEANSQVFSEGRLNLQDVKFILKGNTGIHLDMSAAKVTTDVDGTARIDLKGQAGSHELKTRGAVELNAFDFISGIYLVDLKGLAKVNINVLNDLKVKTSGATEIYYKGNPKNVNEQKTGAGKLEKVN